MTRYAETWLDVGRLPLRRRDRAAMVLALEVTREEEHSLAVNDTMRAHGGPVASSIGEELHEAWEAMASDRSWETGWLPGRGDRLIRARLALLLRVLLRVDAGDYGDRVVCPHCGDRMADGYMGGEGIVCPKRAGAAVDLAEQTYRVRPLWETQVQPFALCESCRAPAVGRSLDDVPLCGGCGAALEAEAAR